MDCEIFPRGGKIQRRVSVKRKHEDALFHAATHLEKKKSKKEQSKLVNVETKDTWQSSLKLHGTLTYDKIQEEMTVLACVRHISHLTLQIEFPGLTFGLVTINRISDAFTNKLARELEEESNEECYSALKSMFQIGDLLPAKIVSIKHTEKGHEVQATLNPKDINAHKNHTSFKKGLTVWANVTSELDHGYELSVGVKNCRVFLPHKNIDSSKKYSIGDLLYCVIHKAEVSNIATTLTVSAKQDHIDNIRVQDDMSLDDVIPGTKVEFLIEEVLPHGMKGTFLENCLGFIDETQIFSKVNLSKVKEGSVLTAYVLFIEPVTKVTYLTLRGIQTLPTPQYEIGKVIPAEVLSNVSRGLYLKLGKDNTGFVTNKRLLNTLPKNANLDIVSAVHKKYPQGSRHPCRILDYNHMQQIYICTFEQKVIKEEIFGPSDLKVGQKVTVKIDKIISNGVIVKAGHLQGFVPNLHLSNVKYSDNIKKKYTEGMTVDARVLNITPENNVIFTLKQGLVESDKCLTNVEDAIPKTNHVGFVVQNKISGTLIAFYGGVKGWISNKVLNAGNVGPYVDPRQFFFIGQVVSVWVIGFKNDKLQLSLNYPNKKKKIRVGEKNNGKVTVLHDDGIDVEVGQHKVEATIPLAHLGSDLTLNRILLKTYKVGDVIEDIMCIKNVDIPVMSRRECVAFERNQLKIPKFRYLKKDMLLRCSFEGYAEEGILVSTPIKDYHEKIQISNKNLSSVDSVFEKQQCILTKILSVNYKNPNVILSNTVPQSMTNASNLLVSYLEDLNNIIHFGQNNNWKLTEYKIGERVECIVKQIDNDGNCTVTLPNQIKGLATASLCYSNIKIGDIIEAVVLDYNFIDDYVEICCRNDLMQKINRIQGGVFKKPIPSSCVAEILLYTRFYVLGVLKDNQCNRQLVYLPLFYDENGSKLTSAYQKTEKMKIYLERKVGAKIIGLPKKLIGNVLKEVTHKKAEKRKRNVTHHQLNISEEKEEMVDSESKNDDESHLSLDTNKQCIKECSSHSKNADLEGNKGAILSGINSFYETENVKEIDESSSDEDAEESEPVKKKKKLTTQERKEMAKKEEERILNIEKELADSTATPESAEQFDRLLLANPNSSELWLKYMAMHVASTELDKARAVGKKALETINMTLVKEKFNVWMALLNLENMYGTKETFEKIFEDAVRYNDSLNIYLNVINLLASSGKLNEMEEKIKKIRSKEKQSSKMWLEIAKVYYTLGKYQEARNIKEAALKSILDKKRQFDLIVKFGIMEFQLGDLEQAIANFETILDTYPSKINIWIIYVDQLVKKKNIDHARKVLERASGQKFSVKNMKAIFQKFISFEEQYGTPDSITYVKNKTKQYVEAISKGR